MICKSTGVVLHSLLIDGVIEELYDVVLLPGTKNMLLGGLKDELSMSIISLLQ